MEKVLPNPERFRVETALDVRWGDMDALRHVNNSRYLTYCEMANFEWFAKVAPGQELLDSPIYPVVARVECDFLASVTYPASLSILTRAIRIGRSSLCLEHLIRDAGNGKNYTLIHLTLVFIDHETHESKPIPEEIRTNIRELDGI